MNQENQFISESEASNPTAEAPINRLLDLLSELRILDSPKQVMLEESAANGNLSDSSGLIEDLQLRTVQGTESDDPAETCYSCPVSLDHSDISPASLKDAKYDPPSKALDIHSSLGETKALLEVSEQWNAAPLLSQSSPEQEGNDPERRTVAPVESLSVQEEIAPVARDNFPEMTPAETISPHPHSLLQALGLIPQDSEEVKDPAGVQNSQTLVPEPTADLSHSLSHQEPNSPPEIPAPSSQIEENLEETADAFERLQSLLFGTTISELEEAQKTLSKSELPAFREMVTTIEQKIAHLEHQIYDPQELMNLLLPWIAELLSLKVSQARDEVAKAIAPIIDEAIQKRAEEDQRSVITTLAPLLPKAIATQIHNHPEEIARAIAPEIAIAVREQIRLSRDALAEALSPIVDKMIQNKSQEDRTAIIAAISPLLPAAITEQIRQSPDEIAKAIGPEIASAIREQIRLDRESIAQALGSEMGNAIKAQIELERDAMVDALYPVIGNTISRYLSEAIQAINEKVSNALSVEGIQRKIRSKVQGVSEAELILQESIPFTVQAVFLIHKASGIVISEIQASKGDPLESEMVAGMLTAIRSFVNDCIVKPGEVSELNEIEYGGSKIILEVAGYCYLAVVITGEPAKEYITQLRKNLSTIVLKYGKKIEAFNGDPVIIPEPVHHLVRVLIETTSKEKPQQKPLALLTVFSVVLGMILIPWIVIQRQARIEQKIEQTVVNALASTPELAVYRLNVDVVQNTLKLTGQVPNQNLRLKAEQVVKAATPALTLENQIIAVDVPPDPVITAAEVKRVTAVLNQMDGVKITSQYEGRKVTVEGTVMQMSDARKIAQSMSQIPGVQSVVSAVKLNPLKISTRIYFEAGATAVNPAYQETLVEVQEFLQQYPNTSLKLIGHSDRYGTAVTNQKLALQRAEAVRESLVKQGVNPKRLQVTASSRPPEDVQFNQPLLLSRCVILEPIIQGRNSK